MLSLNIFLLNFSALSLQAKRAAAAAAAAAKAAQAAQEANATNANATQPSDSDPLSMTVKKLMALTDPGKNFLLIL